MATKLYVNSLWTDPAAFYAWYDAQMQTMYPGLVFGTNSFGNSADAMAAVAGESTITYFPSGTPYGDVSRIDAGVTLVFVDGAKLVADSLVLGGGTLDVTDGAAELGGIRVEAGATASEIRGAVAKSSDDASVAVEAGATLRLDKDLYDAFLGWNSFASEGVLEVSGDGVKQKDVETVFQQGQLRNVQFKQDLTGLGVLTLNAKEATTVGYANASGTDGFDFINVMANSARIELGSAGGTTDLGKGSNLVLVGSNADFAVRGTLENVQTVLVAGGSYVWNADAKKVELGHTSASFGALKTGAYNDVVNVGAFASLAVAGDLDLGAGVNTVVAGYKSDITVGGDLKGVAVLSVVGGSSRADGAGIVVAGVVGATGYSDVFALGNYARAEVGAVDFGAGVDVLAIGNYSEFVAGEIKSAEVISVGAYSTAVLKADAAAAAGVLALTVGYKSTLYVTDEMAGTIPAYVGAIPGYAEIRNVGVFDDDLARAAAVGLDTTKPRAGQFVDGVLYGKADKADFLDFGGVAGVLKLTDPEGNALTNAELVAYNAMGEEVAGWNGYVDGVNVSRVAVRLTGAVAGYEKVDYRIMVYPFAVVNTDFVCDVDNQTLTLTGPVVAGPSYAEDIASFKTIAFTEGKFGPTIGSVTVDPVSGTEDKAPLLTADMQDVHAVVVGGDYSFEIAGDAAAAYSVDANHVTNAAMVSGDGVKGKFTASDALELTAEATLTKAEGLTAINTAYDLTLDGVDTAATITQTVTDEQDSATLVVKKSKIGGNVVMGDKDAPKGDNYLELHTFTVGTGEDAKDYSATIGGNVEQYAGTADNYVMLNNDTTSAEDETTASISTGNITQVGGYNDVDVYSKDVKIQLGDISQESEHAYYDSNYIGLKDAFGSIGAVSQKVEVEDVLDDDGKVIKTDETGRPVSYGSNQMYVGGSKFGGFAMKGISQEADGGNKLGLDGDVHQIGDGSEEDPYQDELSDNRSTVTGDIVQKSTNTLDEKALAAATELSELATDNEIGLSVTDVTGNISQTSNNRNKAVIAGDVIETHYKDGNGDEWTYDQVISMKVDGSVTQEGGLNNSLDVDDASITGKVTQSSSIRNKASFSSTDTDYKPNWGKKSENPDDDTCEYADDPAHPMATTDHVNDTLKVAASFNTQTVGDVKQTITLPDEEVLKAVADKGLHAYNLVEADNTNVGNITQVNAYGSSDASKTADFISNRIEVEGAEINRGVEYTAEIDTDLAPVTKIRSFTATNSVTVGNIDQTGIDNDALLEDVSKVGTVKQTAATGKDAAGVNHLANNYVSIEAAADHHKHLVLEASWDATNTKEVFTPAVLAGTENKRFAAQVGAIEQLNAATGNYDDQTANTVELTTVDVTGDVVQTATEKDANVLNSFTATTTKQQFTDVYVDKGEIKAIDGGYERATLNKIDGTITQTGFKNTVTLTGTGVTGAVSQTAGVISDYDSSDAVSAQKFGSNEFKAYGLEKDKEVLVKDPDKMENIKLEAKDNIVEIASITQTLDAQMDDKFMTVNNNSYGNYVELNLAKTASITQDATGNGNNYVMLKNGSEVTSISQTNAQFTWKDGEDVEQTTTGTSGVQLINSTVGTITQSSGNDTIILYGDSVLGSASLGDGDDTIMVNGNAKVTGTLDFGAQSPAGEKDDILTITSKTADLSEATLKNVERIVLNNFMGSQAGNVIKVTEIDTGDLDLVKGKYTNQIASLDVDKLTVGKFTFDSGLTIGDVDGTAKSAVNLTFNEGLGEKATLVGTKLADADDAVTFNKSITAAVEIKDFESVTFAKGAQATDDTTWTGTGTIEFDLSSIEGFKDTTDKGTASFTLGDITDYYDGSFPTGDYDRVVFLAADQDGTGDNRFTYTGYDLGTASHVWTSEDTSDKITKTSMSMAVTYVNV